MSDLCEYKNNLDDSDTWFNNTVCQQSIAVRIPQIHVYTYMYMLHVLATDTGLYIHDYAHWCCLSYMFSLQMHGPHFQPSLVYMLTRTCFKKTSIPWDIFANQIVKISNGWPIKQSLLQSKFPCTSTTSLDKAVRGRIFASQVCAFARTIVHHQFARAYHHYSCPICYSQSSIRHCCTMLYGLTYPDKDNNA